jgi:hypothetical protein
MSAKVGDFNHIQDRGVHELLNPRLGDYIGLLPICLHQVPMRHEYRIVLLVSRVEVIDLEIWDLSQLGSNCTYPLQEVHSDQCVFEIMWDTVVVNHAIQRRDVFW